MPLVILNCILHFFFLRYFILKKPLMTWPKKDCAVLPLPTELILKKIFLGTKHSHTYMKATSCYRLSLV